MVQYFLPPEPRGGAEREAAALADWLVAQGIDSQIIGVMPAGKRSPGRLAVPVRPIGWNGLFDSAVYEKAEDYSGLRRFAQFARYDGYLLALNRFLRSSHRPGDLVVFSYLSPVSAVGCRACEGLCPTVTEWVGEADFHLDSFRQTAVRPARVLLALVGVSLHPLHVQLREGDRRVDRAGHPRGAAILCDRGDRHGRILPVGGPGSGSREVGYPGRRIRHRLCREAPSDQGAPVGDGRSRRRAEAWGPGSTPDSRGWGGTRVTGNGRRGAGTDGIRQVLRIGRRRS